LPKVVCNSSPLIHLAKIGKLELLKDYFTEISIPEAVYRECVIDGKDREDAKRIENAAWIRVVDIKNVDLKKAFNTVLDEGESEAIVLALQESADLILLDDYEARELARTYGLKITGTIGLLIKAKYEGDISSIDEMLKKLRRTGFWLSDDLYTKILRDEGES
jgi:predicted nucleic acid-binding protein